QNICDLSLSAAALCIGARRRIHSASLEIGATDQRGEVSIGHRAEAGIHRFGVGSDPRHSHNGTRARGRSRSCRLALPAPEGNVVKHSTVNETARTWIVDYTPPPPPPIASPRDPYLL